MLLKLLVCKVSLLLVLLFFILGSLPASSLAYMQVPLEEEEIDTDIEESIEITSPTGKRDEINFNIFEDIA
ncbi:MAG: hypothetical protein EG828_16150, partial [Deltaproteobacteria bacterium]|nr:hypothetical protein [Deltaproteobacteria bacterium]